MIILRDELALTALGRLEELKIKENRVLYKDVHGTVNILACS